LWGFFTEEFQHKNQESEVVRVRFNNMARKREGMWQFIWGHRDAQTFDDAWSLCPPSRLNPPFPLTAAHGSGDLARVRH
jgi:hypothetical protein